MNDSTLLGFVLVSLAVLLVPGPGVLYVVSRGLSQGYKASVVSAFGLSVGVLFHVVFAVAGLSAVVLTSASAFTLVKYVGAGYLIYLGIQAIRAKSGKHRNEALSPQSLKRLFFDGVVVSVFNPKIALFFLAFLPQFVSPESVSPQVHILMLGLLYAALAFVTDSAYGLLAVSAGSMARNRLTQSRGYQYVTGGLLIGLGIKSAMTNQALQP